MTTEATTPAVENVSTDEQVLQSVLTDENASIKDFVNLANASNKIYDLNFVTLLEDLADSIAKKITPPNQDNVLQELTEKLLAAKSTEDRLKFSLQLQDEINKSGQQFEEIKKLTADLSDEDFFYAHADRIQRLVDSEIVGFLKRSQRAVLKFKRAERPEGVADKPKKAKETVSFTFKGKDYKDIKTAAQGAISGDLAVIAKATGLATRKEIFAAIKDPAQAKKLGFTNVKLQTIAPPVVTTTPDTAEA
jgi:hypothetical protein